MTDPTHFQRGRYRAVAFHDGDKTLYRIEIDAMGQWLPYGEGGKLVLIYTTKPGGSGEATITTYD